MNHLNFPQPYSDFVFSGPITPKISTGPLTNLEQLVITSSIDLTTLSGDDTEARVQFLCEEAVRSQVAAVCVYPAYVSLAKHLLQNRGIKVATVAAGFPHGLSPLVIRIDEVAMCAELGADEIDIVIRRSHALTSDWQALYDEVAAFKKAAGKAHLKSILATGELSDYEMIYRASMVCLLAGSDFIKISTGKEAVNATLEAATAILQSLAAYRSATGVTAGLKVAGGVRSAAQAVDYLRTAVEVMGDEYATPNTFRIGASRLLG